MGTDTPKETLVLYYQQTWDKLVHKWKGKADLKDVFAPEHTLGQWRKMAQELYALELRLPVQRAAAAHQRVSSIRVRRRRGGARGLGRGRPGWFLTDYRGAWQRASSVLGRNTSRTAPVRLKNSQPFRGIWPEAAQRYFHPLSQACSGKYRRRLSA